MVPTLAVNGRFLHWRVTGVERYAREVSSRLPGRLRLLAPTARVQGLRGQLWEQLILPRLIDTQEVLWSPANTGPLSVSRQVVTIHDTLVLEHPEWFEPAVARWHRFLLPRLARRAQAIVTISEYTRRKLIGLLHVPDEQVARIPAGVDLERFTPVPIEETGRIRHRFNLPGDYFLFVGSIEPRKNLGRLLEAWGMIQPFVPRMRLVIAGDCPRGMLPFKANRPVTGVYSVGYVSEEDLPALYSGALAFVSPSLEEVSGMTALEAMACGVPVIAANNGAYPEVAGEAALLVDPLSAEAIANAMDKVLSDAQLQADLCWRGLARAQSFSWDAAAARITSIL